MAKSQARSSRRNARPKKSSGSTPTYVSVGVQTFIVKISIPSRRSTSATDSSTSPPVSSSPPQPTEAEASQDTSDISTTSTTASPTVSTFSAASEANSIKTATKPTSKSTKTKKKSAKQDKPAPNEPPPQYRYAHWTRQEYTYMSQERAKSPPTPWPAIAAYLSRQATACERKFLQFQDLAKLPADFSWTPELEATLVQGRKAGMTIKEIAADMGLPVTEVERKSAKLRKREGIVKAGGKRKRGVMEEVEGSNVSVSEEEENGEKDGGDVVEGGEAEKENRGKRVKKA